MLFYFWWSFVIFNIVLREVKICIKSLYHIKSSLAEISSTKNPQIHAAIEKVYFVHHQAQLKSLILNQFAKVNACTILFTVF